MGRDVQYVEMARNRFESITFFKRRDDVGLSSLQVFSLFSYVDFLAKCTGYAVPGISRDACKSITNVDGSYRS